MKGPLKKQMILIEINRGGWAMTVQNLIYGPIQARLYFFACRLKFDNFLIWKKNEDVLITQKLEKNYERSNEPVLHPSRIIRAIQIRSDHFWSVYWEWI